MGGTVLSYASIDPPVANEPITTHRFRFIDGLRALAAMTVMIFHFFAGSEYQASINDVIPHFAYRVLGNGYLGVEIFFVLSGFVMAHSQRKARVDLRYLGNFAIRRSLRLDPAYWLTILLVLTIGFVHLHIFHDSHARIIPLRVTLANMFYLQLLLKTGAVVDIAWTLCYEVQFYLALSILTGIAQKFFDRPDSALSQPRWGWREPGRMIVFIPFSLLSLIPFGWFLHIEGMFIDYWYMFFMGVMAQWVYDRRVKAQWFVGYAVIVAACLPVGGGWPRVVALLSAIVIVVVAQRGRLDRLLTSWPLQHLGRISYSIYLLHSVLIGVILEAGIAMTGRSSQSIFGWTCAAIPITLVAATLMYFGVEKPGVELGKRFRSRSERRSAALALVATSKVDVGA